MPTLTDLRREFTNHVTPNHSMAGGEELITDSRASLRPSQMVERKLQARSLAEFSRPTVENFRPRAK